MHQIAGPNQRNDYEKTQEKQKMDVLVPLQEVYIDSVAHDSRSVNASSEIAGTESEQ